MNKTITIEGMLGPAKSPWDFGFVAGDSHLIMDDKAERIRAFDYDGRFLWGAPALAKGVYGDNQLNIKGGDTPYGLYSLGQRFDDYSKHGDYPAENPTLKSFGWMTFDMVELENQEKKRGRAGICLHGGGSACGWPGAWAPRQPLHPTFGCIRMHNEDCLKLINPLWEQGTVYVSVFQEDY